MHYYSFHIGDYRAATAHLTNEEDLAYRRLIDMYYDSEGCIPLDTQWVSRRIRVAIEVVELVLKDMFEHTENGWKSQRCDDEIARYRHNAEKNKANGSKGGRPKKNPMETQWEPNQKATNNHKPITNNQEPIKNTNADALDGFDEFWVIYERKGTKKQAMARWKKLNPSIELQLEIYDAARLYVKATPDIQFRKNAETWLNNECWNDVIHAPKPKAIGFFGQLGMMGEGNEQLPPALTGNLG